MSRRTCLAGDAQAHLARAEDPVGQPAQALDFRGRALSRTIGLAWRRTSARTQVYEVLIDYVRESIQRWFADLVPL